MMEGTGSWHNTLFRGNGRSLWYTRVRHLFVGCVYNNGPDIEGIRREGRGLDLTGRIHVEEQQGETRGGAWRNG